MTSAKIIKDSVNPAGNRIVTGIWKYPRYIHSEIMTHRMMAKNAASSRAIPIKKMIDMVMNDPVIPVKWGKNQPGMQSAVFLEGAEAEEATRIWLEARDAAVDFCGRLVNRCDIHKQFSNRLLEPWMHITIVITATEWGNFFNLRAKPDVHPDFMDLAFKALHQYHNHVPDQLGWGEWHLPFSDKMPEGATDQDKLKIATARAARLSYLTFEGVMDPTKDGEIHEKLVGSGHWSPTEHCAQAEDAKPDYWNELWEMVRDGGGERLLHDLWRDLHRDQGCLRGWTPYRKRFPQENRSELDAAALLEAKPDWIALDELEDA